MQDGNTSLLNNFTTQNLSFIMQNNETITINGEIIERDTAIPLLEILHKPSENGTTALHLSADLNGVGELKIIENELNASTLIAGRSASMYSSVIDNTGSTGGFIHSFSVTAIGNGNATIEALGVFSGIVPIHHHSGAPVNVTRALLYTGVFVDVTEAFSNTGNDTSMFVSNGDSVYVGHTSIFSEIQFALGTHAGGAGIKPIFEYSTGAGGWTSFNPLDGTDGMRSDGSIAIETLAGWATDTISGSNIYWIRINRTQAGLGTVPIEDFVQIVAGTDYIWNEDGDVEINNMNVTADLIVTGTSDFNGIVDGNGNAFNNIGAACNDLGDPNNFCKSIFNGFVAIGTSTLNFPFTVKSLVAGGASIMVAQADDNGIVSIIGKDAADNGNFKLYTGAGAIPIQILASGTSLLQATSFQGNDITGLNELKSDGDITNLIELAGTGINIKTNNGGGVTTTRLNIIEGATATITMSAANFAVPVNDTLSMFSDAVRVANIFSVVNTAKSQVTGLLLESDFVPNIGEVFNTGDIVCFYKPFAFTKCNQDGDNLVIGPVYLLGERGIVGYQDVTKYRMVKETEFYAKNETDADGNIKLLRATRDILIPFRDTKNVTLDDGSTELMPFINYHNSWINQSYIESVAIWGDVDTKTYTVIEGPLSVKACNTITKGQFLIAGEGGCALGVDNVPINSRYFGIAVGNSRGGYVDAYIP